MCQDAKNWCDRFSQFSFFIFRWLFKIFNIGRSLWYSFHSTPDMSIFLANISIPQLLKYETDSFCFIIYIIICTIFVSTTFAIANFRQIRPLHINRGWNAEFRLEFGDHLPPKPETLRGANRYLTQSRLQVKGYTAERYCLLHVVVQGPGSFRYRSTFLYDVRLRSYGAWKLPNFRILAHFPHTKPVKSFRWMISIFPCGSRRSIGVPSGSGVFLRLLVWELWTPKLPKFLPMGNGYTLTECYYMACQIWTEDVGKCVDRQSLHS